MLVSSDDEDNFDAGDVAEPGMNGVCARPIGPSDLLYGGTTTYCIVAMYGLVAHFSLVVWGGKGGIARAATLTGHHRHPAVQSSSSSSPSAPLQTWPSAPPRHLPFFYTLVNVKISQ